MLRSVLKRLNHMWPWSTPHDRLVSRRYWARKAEVIRANRITQSKVHVKDHDHSSMTSHGQDPYHCVCNGTHVNGFFCPRCPQPYIINDRLVWK